MLTVTDHRRDESGRRYVYAVVSRRAGGVSLGINLNPNNACNWACVYCQVPNLTRGAPPPLDLGRLERELRAELADILHGDFMQRKVPAEGRSLRDVAFSGNGEPTAAAEFPAAVDCVIRVIDEMIGQGEWLAAPAAAAAPVAADFTLRLITNGSLLHRARVRQGIARIGAYGGEVWFKVDRATAAGIAQVNGVAITPESMLSRLSTAAGLARTWVQTCWFAIDGQAPDASEEDAYLALLTKVRDQIAGVHLYGLARPSMQPDAPRLTPLAPAVLESLAARLRALGIKTNVSR